jgi:starvation-inducible DNA-binding protein
MLAELLKDSRAYAEALRAAHEPCDEHKDVATASLIETWIDEAERRLWFLTETTRMAQLTCR